MTATDSRIPADAIAHALAYPFAVPQMDFAFVGGDSLRVERPDPAYPGRAMLATPDGPIRLDAFAAQRGTPCPVDPAEWIAIASSGSNAAPDQLARKFAEDLPRALLLCLRATLPGISAVYSAHVTAYGSIPATLIRAQEAEGKLFVMLLPRTLLPALHATEALGRNYGFFEITGAGEARLDDGTALPMPLHAYLSLHGALRIGGRLRYALPHLACARTDSILAGQRLVQQDVRSLYDRRLALPEFIARNLADAAHRRHVIECLADGHAEPAGLDGLKRLDEAGID